MRERNTETSPRRALTPRVSPLQLAHVLLKTRAWALTALFCGIAVIVSHGAMAQDSADNSAAPRLLALISGSAPLRLTLERDLGQKRLGPISGNVLLGYALQGGRLQHGFGVGVSWNATHDGGYTTPVYALDQIALMPAYFAYLQLNPDVFAVAHLGLPVLVRGGPSAGLEVGAMIAYRVFAGTGVFAGLDLSSHIAHSLSVFASLELGVVIDYEVLP
jgi:hypothetical protein